MILRNTSTYPTEVVRDLIEFAAQEVSLTRVCINVKSSSKEYGGMAYACPPREYSKSIPKSAKRLVVLRFGPEDRVKFPINNVQTHYKWVKVAPNEEYDPKDKDIRVTVSQVWRLLTTKHPYGGKSSPVVEWHNWKEMILGLAAHELGHIWQYDNNLAASEVFCERRQLRILTKYREMNKEEKLCHSLKLNIK